MNDLDIQELHRMLPNGAGAVGLYSSDEFFDTANDFDRQLIELSGPRVGLVFCADHRAAPRSARLGMKHFQKLNAEPFVLDLHEEQDQPTDLVYIAGGNPAELLNCMRTQPTWNALKQRWQRGELALAGSSAGAMMLCTNATVPKPGDNAPTQWTTTEGVVDAFAVAVHASSRKAEWLQQIADSARVHVLALSDRTGVILSSRGTQVIGPGTAWFI